MAARTVVAADGTRLNVLDLGDPGLPVVFAAHGFASSAAANWIASGWERPLAEAGYHLVAPDLRGHGESDKPTDPERYRVPIIVDDAIRVLDAVGAEHAHWLGYSFGSRLGLEVARAHPGRIASLSLGGAAPTEPSAERLLQMLDELGLDDPALRAFAHGVSGSAPPPPDAPLGVPTVFVTGDADDVAAGNDALAAALGARSVTLPGRTHVNAITSRAFKDAVLENLRDAG